MQSVYKNINIKSNYVTSIKSERSSVLQMSPIFSAKEKVTVTGKSQLQCNPFTEFILIKNQVTLSFPLN